MKTIDKNKYVTPQVVIVLVQNQQALLTGSTTTVNIGGRDNGGEIGDYDD